ncbi:cilia-and flagella-associated protein 96-like [Antedon mediterranea]|uniref:cilia-and flagella-associated protein 96-like n=1 Tax=Antedon mediterranea TaxID=105859 RepID=UPI003AF4CA58
MAGKTDMERLGLFQEMGYTTIGDRYVGGGNKSFNVSAHKNKQMLPGGSKTRSSNQVGYFDSKFNRVLEGEAYSDPVKRRRQERIQNSKKNIGKAFLPSNGDKKPSGNGNHYGTFSGPVSAFSPVKKGGKQYKSPGKNVITNPGKIGTGYGFVGLTLGKGYTYSSNHFDKGKELRVRELDDHKKAMKGGSFKLNMHPKSYFDGNPYVNDKPLPPVKKQPSVKKDFKPFKPSSPAKKIAGSKAGTFDPYPSHSEDPYRIKVIKKGPPSMNSSGKIFMPSPGPKSAPTNSIVTQNVIRRINRNNFMVAQSSYS